MKTQPAPQSTPLVSPPTGHPEELSTPVAAKSEGPRPSFLGRMVLTRMESIESGKLSLFEGGRSHTFGQAQQGLPDATIEVCDPRFWAAIALRGSVGAGESYSEGWWRSEEPVAVIRTFVRNQDALDGIESGAARISKPLLAGYHALRRNSEKGSAANIRAHYDVSNEFFGLFLDPTMTYSCGVFETEDATLEQASIAKIDRLCRKLELAPDDHLLEIGTGWGAFALHAAREYGCRVTTTTISKEQHALAKERIHAAGLEDRITLLFEDYRRLEGQFDKLVSVEMIEAVGAQYYPEFFERCAKLLKPEGKLALQAITIADQHFERARRSVDFIQRHVFPGSCIPSVTALCTAATKASDLRITGLDDIGPHYVRTLALWREALLERWDDARAMGYSNAFLRQWEFYFAYCEGGFAERHISDVHMVFEKPGTRPALNPPPA